MTDKDGKQKHEYTQYTVSLVYVDGSMLMFGMFLYVAVLVRGQQDVHGGPTNASSSNRPK